MFLPHYGFSYLDSQNVVQTWIPKEGEEDTLTIPYFNKYLELAGHNPYSSIRETFLVQNGDTIIFNYKNNLPTAAIINRKVNDTALNYNRFRLKHLFQNKYSSHHQIFGNIFLGSIQGADKRTVNYYLRAKKDYLLEKSLLDSLLQAQIISPTDHQYRIDALNVLMEKHKKFKTIKEWLNKNEFFRKEGKFAQANYFDLEQTDSLMVFSFFRDHLNNISGYNLSRITEHNGSSGGNYIDSRVRFDSILQDKRFNQRARDFLLFEAYDGIGKNFRIKDKQEYLKKLEQATTHPARLKKLVNDYDLNFEYSDQLLVTTRTGDTLTYQDILNMNRGKWLYVDFWASWCAPCRRAMPASIKLKENLKKENVEFLYLSFKDDPQNWKAAIKADSIEDGQHYFIVNGNTSKVIEDLGVKTIPHYIIYGPDGEIKNGFANRPGRGAKAQLEAFLKI